VTRSPPLLRRSDGDTSSLSSAIADLHKFSLMQSLYKAAVHLLEDLHAHIKLLHTPERAQVLPAAAQVGTSLHHHHHLASPWAPPCCVPTAASLQALHFWP
jgi:hypothetical protein